MEQSIDLTMAMMKVSNVDKHVWGPSYSVSNKEDRQRQTQQAILIP